MSGSSKHHRATNTFRFRTFHERLADINIDVVRKLGKFAATPQDEDTFFGEALARWTELNLTLHFVAFRNDIRGEVGSFVQLLHNKEEVVEALEKHLQVDGSMALTPLLDLVVQLARDLQADFYPYFERFLRLIAALLNKLHHDVPLLESAFTCLAHIFKFLWRRMVTDMENVYTLFSPLLSGFYRPYIQAFAADSFSFLMRKVKDKGQLFTYLFQRLAENPKEAPGLGVLLFQMLKGVKKQFHSSATTVLRQLLDKLGETGLMHEPVVACLAELFLHFAKHTDAEHCRPVLACLMDCMTAVHEGLQADPTNWIQLSHVSGLLQLLRVLITYREGMLIQPCGHVAQVLEKLLAGAMLSADCGQILLDVVVDLLLAPRCYLDQHRQKLINLAYSTAYDRQLLFDATAKLFELPLKERDLKPAVELYCHRLCVADRHPPNVDLSAAAGAGRKKQETGESGDDVTVMASRNDTTAPKQEMGVTSYMVHNDVMRLLLAWSHRIAGDVSMDFAVAINRCAGEGGKGESFPVWLVRQLRRVAQGPQMVAKNACFARALVHCLPLTRPITEEERAELLVTVLERCVEIIRREEHSEAALALLWETVQSLEKSVESKAFVQKIGAVVDFVELLRRFPTNVHLLESACAFHRVAKRHRETREQLLSEEKFKALWPTVVDNVSSPYHLIRKHTLDICRQFSLALPLREAADTGLDQVGVFEICHAAESTEAGVLTYRDKLRHLRKLHHAIVHNQIPIADPSLVEVPLRYLLGVYYVHMKLLLGPVGELIASHARGLPRDKFWRIYHARLLDVAGHTEKRLEHKQKPKKSKKKMSEDEGSADCSAPLADLFLRHDAQRFTHRDGANHVMARELLWVTMRDFPQVAEARSNLLVPLFFRFLKNEFYSMDLEKSNFMSIQRKTPKSSSNENNVVDLTRESENENEVIDLTNESKGESDESEGEKRRGTASVKDLITHLKLFASFKKPKSLHMEPQLRELYLDLLCWDDVEVQKVAFECILTYDHKYLTPYKENFDNLLDDMKFRSELVLFGIDPQMSAIQADHRGEIVPLLMRILYGKMQGKAVKNKMTLEEKRTVIIRFLGGTTRPELDVFLSLLLEPIKDILSGEILTMVEEEMASQDVTHIAPLAKQATLLNTLELIVKKLGNLVDMDLSLVLRVMVVLHAQHVRLLDMRDSVARHYISPLKALRQHTARLITQFFEKFVDTFNFSQAEVDAVFAAAVWPRLAKLHFEGLRSRTGLTALFYGWSQHSRYFPLFGVVHTDDPSMTPLPKVLQLLSSSKVEKAVSSALLEIVENLLTVEDFVATENVKVIVVNRSVPLEDRTDLSLGTRLVLRHVTEVLEYLRRKVAEMAQKKGRQVTLPEMELTILSKLSEYVSDEEQSTTITRLLLPFLGRRISRKPETEAHILTAVSHLLARVSHPEHFVVDIARLFSVLRHRDSRAALCDAFSALAERLPRHARIAAILHQTNAWDAKHVDEVDYVQRLDGFRAAVKYVGSASAAQRIAGNVRGLVPGEALGVVPEKAENMAAASTAQKPVVPETAREVAPDEGDGNQLDRVFFIAVIHQSAFVLATTEDMSLRDNAGWCMAEVVSKIAECGQDSAPFTELVLGHILPLVKEKVRCSKEAARHEFLGILASLVKHFPAYPQFSALVPLRSYTDVEEDIFTSLTHVQLPRRAKGLRRLAKYLDSRDVPLETVVYYLLPVVMAFLSDPRYTQQRTLAAAAIDCLSAVCRVLPWRHYLPMVRHFASRLTQRRGTGGSKFSVRLLVTALDAFHFDLSLSQPVQALGQGNSANGDKSDGATNPEAEEKEKPVDNDEVDIGLEVPEGDVTDGDDVIEGGDPEKNSAEREERARKGRLSDERVDKQGVKLQRCSEEQATKIHRTLMHVIIPQMNGLLTAKAKSDDHHKKSGAGKFAEDQEILRVPLALAMVKLLQTLPESTLQSILPSILLKICVFLRSRAQDIRVTARATLVKVLLSLGPTYFLCIANELIATLQKGYQLHVLSYTLWDLLRSLLAEGKIESGDLDSSIPAIVQVFNDELFGAVSEEKEVAGITGKLMEAKQVKGYEAYALLARCVGRGALAGLIAPLKQVCDATQKHADTKKVTETLRRMAAGLVTNPGLDLQTTLTFIYGLVTETMPSLSAEKSDEKKKQTTDGDVIPSRFVTDTYLVPREPSRGHAKPKAHAVTNSHVIVDFGLQVLLAMFKKSVIHSTNTSHLELLDPFVEPLTACLTSKHIKVIVTALRCFVSLLRLPLPSLKQHVVAISNHVFVLLHKYGCVGGATSSENFDLMLQCFKVMAVLVGSIDYHTIDESQLKVLLTYVEQDLHDYTRQATALSLLKAIIHRRLVTPQMEDVIIKVEQLSVEAQEAHVRQQCRQVASSFVMDYPLGEQLQKHVEYYMRQLEYPYESGRASALEMAATMFSIFPAGVLGNYADFFFLPLATRLVNDESSECRRHAQLAIKQLLIRIDGNRRDVLFNMCLTWMRDSKVEIRKLAAISSAPFVAVEAAAFSRHLAVLLPVIETQIHPDKYTLALSPERMKVYDHLLYNLLNLLCKILRECDVIHSSTHAPRMTTIWDHVRSHCAHPHMWVKLAAAQLFGLYFAAWKPEELLATAAAAAARKSDVIPAKKKKKKKKRVEEEGDGDRDSGVGKHKSADQYLCCNLEEKLHDLCGAFCMQLTLVDQDADLAEQITKNLVFIGKILIAKEKGETALSKQVDAGAPVQSEKATRKRKNSEEEEKEEEEEEVQGKRASFRWLLKKLCREAWGETAQRPHIIILRSSVFKWIAAIGLELGSDRIQDSLNMMLGPLVREYTDSSKPEDNELKALSAEVLQVLKQVAGVDAFSAAFADKQQRLTHKRRERKRLRAAEVVSRPEVAVMRKMKRHRAKQEARKRKLRQHKTPKGAKKPKRGR